MIARQRGRGFGALGQVIGRTAIPFLRKHVVPMAKRKGPGMLKFAAPEIEDVISSRKSFRTVARSVGKQTLKNIWAAVVNRGESFEQNLLNNPLGRADFFYKHFSLIITKNNFRHQPFLAVSGNLGWKVSIVHDVLSSHEQEFYPTTSPYENCAEFEFQKDRNYYVNLRQSILASKLKFVIGRGY